MINDDGIDNVMYMWSMYTICLAGALMPTFALRLSLWMTPTANDAQSVVLFNSSWYMRRRALISADVLFYSSNIDWPGAPRR